MLQEKIDRVAERLVDVDIAGIWQQVAAERCQWAGISLLRSMFCLDETL
jgi:hypothetical protein